MSHMLKCRGCKNYTLKAKCPECGEGAINPSPPKYSPDDKYGKYRRQVKSEALKKEGLI